jgi:nucleoside-diphosphate-sugar epimerase
MPSSTPHCTLERSPDPGTPPPARRRRALVTGATGFVGSRLAAALVDASWAVRCMVRDRSRAADLERRGFDGVARPLIEGLATKTTVTDPSGAQLFDVAPLSFDEALRRAVADEAAAASVAAPQPAETGTAPPKPVRPGPRAAP